MSKVRYVFESDDDGHCFIVPLALRERFCSLLEKAYETDDFEVFEREFGNTRVDGVHRYSFTDPKEIVGGYR